MITLLLFSLSIFSFSISDINISHVTSDATAENIESLIDPSDIYTVGGWPSSKIVYTHANNQKILHFEDIDEQTTAWIFVTNPCLHNKKFFLKSISCDKNSCIFPDIHEKNLEQNEQDGLFGSISSTIYEFEINPEYREWFKTTDMPLSDINNMVPQYPGWSVSEKSLIHPKSGSIPAVFGGGNGC